MTNEWKCRDRKMGERGKGKTMCGAAVDTHTVTAEPLRVPVTARMPMGEKEKWSDRSVE